MYRNFAPKLYLILTLIAAVSLLAACSLPAARPPASGPSSTATLSPEQVQTQINQMLTQLPTTPGQVVTDPTATLPLPTLPSDATEDPAPVITATDQPTVEPPAPTDTEVPAPTATTEPAVVPTATGAPSDSESGGGIVPTVAVTAISPAATATTAPPSGPTFTPAPGNPRARLGAPTSTDPMNDPDTWIWPTGSDRYTRGSFANGQQNVVALTGADGWRMSNPLGRAFGNLYLEATMRTTTCASTDHYGLIFRVPEIHDPDQGYLFGFTCDGRYSLRRWNGDVGPRGEMTWLVNWTANSAIATGSNQTNRIGVMMVGSRLLLYANGTLLTEVQDNFYQSGYFGVFIGSDVTDQLTIQIDEMSYWENPTP